MAGKFFTDDRPIVYFRSAVVTKSFIGLWLVTIHLLTTTGLYLWHFLGSQKLPAESFSEKRVFHA